MLGRRKNSKKNGAANVALDRGDVLVSFEAKFCGSTPCAQPSGNGACMDAVSRIYAMKKKPISTTVTVTNKGIYVDEKKHALIKKVPLANLSWVSGDPRNKNLFSFISYEPRVNKIECFTFTTKKPGKTYVTACEKALQTQVATTHRAEAEAMLIAASTPIMPAMAEVDEDDFSSDDGHSSEDDFSDDADDDADMLASVERDADPWVSEAYTKFALGCFKAEYRGGAPVTEIEGFKVVKRVATQVKDQGQDAKKEVTIVITQGQIILVERDTGDHLHETPISHVSYSLLDPRDKSHFYYIVNDPRLGFAYCHVLKLLTGHGAIERCIAAAQRAASRDRQRMLRENNLEGRFKSKNHEAIQASIGVHEVNYLGAVRVKEATGSEVAQNAMINLRNKFRQVLNISDVQDWTTVGDKVVLVMTMEGLRIVDLATGEVVHFTFIRNVSFTTHMHSGYDRTNNPEHDIFAYIEVDEKLSRNVCHVFKCPPGVAREICKTANFAFKASMEELERTRTDDPFKALALADGSNISDLFPPHLIINRKDIKAIKILGAGQFGTVWLALHRMRQRTEVTHKHRAVKLLRPGASELDQEDFISEALTMSRLDHPNLVSLVGVSVNAQPWLVVLEFLRYGDLKTVLVASKEKGIKLKYAEHLYFTFQIASGMGYLASKQLVHMDLAARNCLLHTGNTVKVGDFGLTKPYDEGESFYKLKPNSSAKLPAKWMALESLENLVFSEATDVWACGITMWELVTYGAQPYPLLKNKEMRRKLREGVRLEHPQDCPMEFFMEMEKCWTKSVEDRHTFATLKAQLKKMLTAEKERTQLSELRDVGLLLNDGVERELPLERETADKIYTSFHQQANGTSKRGGFRTASMKMMKKKKQGGNGQKVKKVRKKLSNGEYVVIDEIIGDDDSSDDYDGDGVDEDAFGTLSRLPGNYLSIVNSSEYKDTLKRNGKATGARRHGARDGSLTGGRGHRQRGSGKDADSAEAESSSYFELDNTADQYISIDRIFNEEGDYIEVGRKRTDLGDYVEVERRIDDDGNYIEVERCQDDDGNYIQIDRILDEEEGAYIEVSRRDGDESAYLDVGELHKDDDEESAYMKIQAEIKGGDMLDVLGDVLRLNPLYLGTYIDAEDLQDEDDGEHEDGGEEHDNWDEDTTNYISCVREEEE